MSKSNPPQQHETKSIIFQRFQEIEDESSWRDVYMDLNNKTAQMYKNKQTLSAIDPSSQGLNRYSNVLPYDDHRVKLEGLEHDYINASLVPVKKAHRKYILTQGPLAGTSGHFWWMVWKNNCKGIIMLNKCVESRRPKCHQYYPEYPSDDDNSEQHEDITYDDVGLTVSALSCQNISDFGLERKLLLKHCESNESHEVRHFQFLTWPDFGIPDSCSEFLQFLNHIRETGVLSPEEDNQGPPVVHCSAGIGRSGTFCLVDSVIKIIEDKGGYDDVDPIKVLVRMRKHRWGLIQTADQLRFAYTAILEGAKATLENQPGDAATASQETQTSSHFSGCEVKYDKTTDNLINRNKCNSNNQESESSDSTDGGSNRKRSHNHDIVSLGTNAKKIKCDITTYTNV